MKRRLFTILSGLSLLLFVAVVVLWVRSYWVCEGVYHGTPLIARGNTEYVAYRTLHSHRGLVSFQSIVASAARGSITRTTPVGWGRHSFVPRWEDRDVLTRGTTAGFRVSVRSDHHDVITATVPHWVPALLLAVLPACWIGRHFRRRRRGAGGLCAACGYDLRTTPARCPECGTTSESITSSGARAGNLPP